MSSRSTNRYCWQSTPDTGTTAGYGLRHWRISIRHTETANRINHQRSNQMKTILLILVMSATAFANNVQMQWNRNAETDVAGYNVYRSTTSGGGYVKVNPTLVACSAQPCSYLDVGTPNQILFYVVRAVNTAGVESPNSNEATANPIAPAAPTGLTIITVTARLLLSVDKVQVASGPADRPLNFVLPRQTPPREKLITAEVK